MGFHLNIKPQILTAIIHWRYNGAALHRNLFLGMGFMEKAINDEFLKDSLLQLRLVSISKISKGLVLEKKNHVE